MHRNHFYSVASARRRGARGFSLLELVIVMGVGLVLAAMAIPGFGSINRYLHIAGDSRDLNGAVAQAKMRAAANFTHARAYIDLGANQANTFHLEVWDRTLNCWKTDGDKDANGNDRCTTPGVSPVQSLSSGVTFGFGSVGAAPTNTQGAMAQAPACNSVVSTSTWGYQPVANTACVEFNSRGIPLDPATASATAKNALYVTDGVSVYGLTVIASGMIQNWSTNADNSGSWQPR